jgi:hypothetical protein
MLKDTRISPNMLPMETDTDEQLILIQNRFVYGQGTVETHDSARRTDPTATRK